MTKPKLITYCLVLIVLLVLGGCATKQHIKRYSHKQIISTSQPVGQLLLDGFDEERFEGLYSYFLWSDQSELDQQMVLTSKLMELIFKKRVRDHHSGYLYWPVKLKHPDDVFEKLDQQQWDFFIDHYHIERTKVILQRLNWYERAAPLLVIGFYPLGSLARQPDSIQQPIYLMEMSQLTVDEQIRILERLIKGILNKSTTYVEKKWSKKWLINVLKFNRDESRLVEVLKIY